MTDIPQDEYKFPDEAEDKGLPVDSDDFEIEIEGEEVAVACRFYGRVLGGQHMFFTPFIVAVPSHFRNDSLWPRGVSWRQTSGSVLRVAVQKPFCVLKHSRRDVPLERRPAFVFAFVRSGFVLLKTPEQG